MKTREGSQLEPVNFRCVLMVKIYARKQLELPFTASVARSFT